MTRNDSGQKRPPGQSRDARDDFIPFYRPFTDEQEIHHVRESILSGWLTTGPKVRRFESRVCRHLGVKHAVAVNSCTAALHLALRVSGIKSGDEVITSPYTFASTGETILYLGARPVFCDIDPQTLNLDPRTVQGAINRRTRAIVPVHIAGLPCDMRSLRQITRSARLNLIDDAAHAFGATLDGRSIGTLADMTCFSFYATKNLTTGEGGMVTTANRRKAARIRLLSLHGLSHDAWGRYARGGSWRYDVVELGYKYNMSDLAAGLGLAQLAKFKTLQRRRRAIARRYTEGLKHCDAFDLPIETPRTRHAWHLYILRLRPGVLKISRDRLIELLSQKGIGTSVHFQPLHLFTYYGRQLGYRKGDFPNAEREASRAISLPLYPSLELGSQDRVIGTLLDLARHHRR